MNPSTEGLPEMVAGDEDLARFLFKSNDYSSLTVKPSAFLPNPKDRETSVSRHGREPANDLWALGALAAGERKLHGAAILKAADVRKAQLQIAPDEPPPRHAVIGGWPWIEADLELQRAKQKELAMVLACAAGSPVLCK